MKIVKEATLNFSNGKYISIGYVLYNYRSIPTVVVTTSVASQYLFVKNKMPLF